MRHRPVYALAGCLVALAMVFAACGGNDGDGGNEPTNETNGTVLPTCSGDALADTGLLTDFPVPADVTFVEQSTAGPSNVVDGFATDDVDHLWGEWKDVLEQAKYSILFAENEAPDDAEISYESPDKSSTGQIALRNECGGGDKIAVHVTDRPGEAATPS
jgi:hypothetical protein